MKEPKTERKEHEMGAEKIEHKGVRVILKRTEKKPPPDVEREHKLARWVGALYENAMLIAAAGVLASEGTLEKAASALWWAGFCVPPGYSLGHEGEDLSADDEEALRLWVEREAGRIEGVIGLEGFRLAATGTLMDEADRTAPPAARERGDAEEEGTNELARKLAAKMTPQGKELLAKIESRRREAPPGAAPEEVMGDLRSRIEALSAHDRGLFVRVLGFEIEALKASSEENREELANAELAAGVFERAHELERAEGREPDERMTLGEAVEVLERHGEGVPAGLDLDGAIRVPLA